MDRGVRPAGFEEPGAVFRDVLLLGGGFLATGAVLLSSGSWAALAGKTEATESGCFKPKADLGFCGVAPARGAPGPAAVLWELGFVLFAGDWRGVLGTAHSFALGTFGHFDDKPTGASRLQDTGLCFKCLGSAALGHLPGEGAEAGRSPARWVRRAWALGVLEATLHLLTGPGAPGLVLDKVSGQALLPTGLEGAGEDDT